MQALEYQGPGKLAWIEAPEPELVDGFDAIVRPLATATCDLDWEIVDGRAPFPAPFLLGHEFVAEVLSIGAQVSRYSVGDRVSVAFQPSCGNCAPCGLGHSAACRSVAPTSMFGVGAISGNWGGAFAQRLRVPFADNMLVKVPDNLPLTWFSSATDNVADGFRTLDGYLQPDGSSSVLIFGNYDSIPLYTVAFARALGVQQVTFCTKDPNAAANARRLGATVEFVQDWPQRLAAHDVTVCAVQRPEVLLAAIRSTSPGGHCTSTTIFGQGVELPLREMYMRGIHLHTGRVNGAAVNAQAEGWIQSGLIEPLAIDTKIVSYAELIPALLNRTSAKLIATPE